MIGTRLGPYEVTAKLGEGGMGEVYRATDTDLDREVAVKVLPEGFVEDRERLARFEREAKLLAQLHHPHIASIFGLVDAGGTRALVMELVAGPTLAERIAQGPLPPDEALPIARQIAEALESAHERGIVHRDLKPANVKLTPEGEVKVLDFGLAKAIDPATGSDSAADLAHSPTLTYQPTVHGVILGTAAYMAPEQARGLAVDKRADIWAFGVVFWEMLTGRSLFAAGTASDTLAEVLKSTIDLSSLPAGTPPVVRGLLQRCLERDPRRRLRDIGEARIALEDPRASEQPAPPGPTVVRTRPRLSMLVWPALAAALAAAAITALVLGRSGDAVSPEFQQLTFRRGTITGARFAPDGDTVVYSAAWNGLPSEIFTTRQSGPGARSLGLVDASLLAVSRQGELAVQLSPRLSSGLFHGTLARVPLGGGVPRQVTNGVQEADWAGDTEPLVVRREGGAYRWLVEDAAGKVLFRNERGHLHGIRVAPDGRHVALLVGGTRAWAAAPIVVVDANGEHKALGETPATGLAWSPAGDEIWYSQPDAGGASSLWAVDLEGRKRLLLRHAGSLTLLDAADDATLLVSVDRVQRSVYFHAPASSGEHDLAWLDGSLVAAIASDGSRLLLSEVGATEGPDGGVYLRNADGSPPIRLGDGFAMDLSPDGDWTLVTRRDGRDLVLVPTGTGQERSIPLDGDPGQAWFAPDGSRLVVNLNLPDGPTRIVSIAPDGSDVLQLAPDGFDHFIGEHPLSPDGRWMHSLRARDGGFEHRLFPTDGSQRPRELPGFEPGDVVIGWSDDGSALYVFQRNELPARVDRLEIATGDRTAWLELMPADPSGVTRIASVQMTADGRTYAYNVTRQLSDLYLIRGLH